MLKKAGIVAAAAAGALLAVSPLAFAGDKGDHHHGHGGGDKQVNVNEGDESNGLVNVSNNNVNVPIQACNNDVTGTGIGGTVPFDDIDAFVPLTGALALLGTVDQDVDQSFETEDSHDCTQGGNAGDKNLQSNED